MGGTGRAVIALSHLLLPVADRLFAWALSRGVRQPGRPRRAAPAGLHRPGRDGRLYGDQGHLFGRSLSTAVRTHPGAAALGLPRRVQ